MLKSRRSVGKVLFKDEHGETLLELAKQASSSDKAARGGCEGDVLKAGSLEK